jgi:RNA polymerase sigma-70 factor (ECF subfamily)
MHQSYQSEPPQLHLALEQERPYLVRLCTSWLGDPVVAEDVVQETLLEAWRKIENLRDPQAFRSWLSGIARNMSLRRLRQQGRDSVMMQTAQRRDDILATIPTDFDFEVELDRADMAQLLDQALALLPADTRTVLIQKYIENHPHHVIAQQLGISENVVAVRLHRGKLALRKMLAQELQTDANAFGLLTAVDTWQATRIWCTGCGQHRLLGRLNETEFILRCPSCNDEPNSFHSQNINDHPSFDANFKTFRPALKHFCSQMDELFQTAVLQGFVPCHKCNQPLPLQRTVAHYAPPSVRAKRGVHLYCHNCQTGSYESLEGLALNQPQGRDFFQAHPRILALPQQEIERAGVPAVVVSFASVSDNATYDVVLKRDTYETLATYTHNE